MDKITVDPKIMLGKPVVRGTRITVEHILKLLKQGLAIKEIVADYLLPFYGLAMELGPIADWGLNLHKHFIEVDVATMRTSIEGIYAIGDIVTYKNKLKLILNGFAEAATACHDIYKIVHPDTPFHFEYSTSKGV